MTTGDIWSQLDYISQRAAADQDVLQDAIGLGQTVIEDEDKGAIAIGILASTLMKRYRENAVDKFANSIGIGRSTAYKRAKVVLFYGVELLRDMLIDNRTTLSFSHFDYARKAGNKIHALDFLNQWQDNTTTPGAAFIEIQRWQDKPIPPKTIMSESVVKVYRVDRANGRVIFEVGDWADELLPHEGNEVVMIIRENATSTVK